MSKSPISIYNENGGYNFFILKNVIPPILKVIEESGLSYEDAKRVPDELRYAIELICESALASSKFMIKGK